MATERQRALRLAGLYNALPNFLWSGLAWAPVLVFAYSHVARPWLWGMLGVSLVGYLLPAAGLERLRLSSRLAPYQRLGVPHLNRFTQNGDWVNRRLRQRFPAFRQVTGRDAAQRLLRASYHLERFHLVALVFFGLLSGYALGHGHWGWAALLLGLNVGYNLYPMWLQQYLRLRVRGAAKRLRSAAPAE